MRVQLCCHQGFIKARQAPADPPHVALVDATAAGDALAEDSPVAAVVDKNIVMMMKTVCHQEPTLC